MHSGTLENSVLVTGHFNIRISAITRSRYVLVRILVLIAGGIYRIIYSIFVLKIILIDRYPGAGTQKYLRYRKVPQ